MARQPTDGPRPASLTNQQMAEALPRIHRLVDELQNFNVNDAIGDDDPNIGKMQDKLESFLVDVFGYNTVEHNRYFNRFSNLYPGGIESAVKTLQGIAEEFEEKNKSQSSSLRALHAYEGLDVHPEIERAAGQLYRDRHYSNAIEDGVKALNELVRRRIGVENIDGVKLMQDVFSSQNPKLRFNDMKDDSDRDEQKGFQMLFSGAVYGLRNPRAHRLMHDDPERALEFIAFISLLAKLLDEATKN